MQSPNWNTQVFIGRGRIDNGAYHRAIDIARTLFDAHRWPDHLTTRIIIHCVYDAHYRMACHHEQLQAGIDYEFAPYKEETPTP